MIRTAIDSDNIGVLVSLDGRADFLMTYADLIRDAAQLRELQAEIRESELVFIDRGLGDPLDLATIADVEDRALGVAALPGWVERKRKAGKQYLTGYCDRVNLPAVEAIARHELWHFVATLDGTCFVQGWKPLHGPALVQILGEASLGVHADFTLVLEGNWRPAGAKLQDNAPSDGSAPSPLPEDVQALQDRCPGWTITERGEGDYMATQDGTRSALFADSVIALGARIEGLYPGSITP